MRTPRFSVLSPRGQCTDGAQHRQQLDGRRGFGDDGDIGHGERFANGIELDHENEYGDTLPSYIQYSFVNSGLP